MAVLAMNPTACRPEDKFLFRHYPSTVDGLFFQILILKFLDEDT
jgi:hypothetical protein